MKTISFILLSVLSMGLLSACNEGGQAEEIKTVDWYMSNKDAMEAKLKECNNNPGLLENTPNCINAQEAFDQTMINRL